MNIENIDNVKQVKPMKEKPMHSLTQQEAEIIINKGTEPPFTGEYYDFIANGVYQCRQCDYPLYCSKDKFHSGCGWPSFDDEVAGAVIRIPDPDGRRIEIVCAHCKGHLGHVFLGERHTAKNVRHCVNSLSMRFVPLEQLFTMAGAGHSIYGAAVFAAGCFWGVEQKFSERSGVLATAVGYTGGLTQAPTYEQVCRNNTGHAEAVQIIYHKQQVDYQSLVNFFFNIHDATQLNRQGPDTGSQYRSAIFYLNNEQQKIALAAKAGLQKMGIPIATEIVNADKFWQAEDYHQKYFTKHTDRRYSCG